VDWTGTTNSPHKSLRSVSRLETRLWTCRLCSAMSWLTSFALYVFHAIYTLVTTLSSIPRYFANTPQPLSTQRTQVPKHLALILASDNCIPEDVWETDVVDNVEQIVGWCREAGIHRLTVYDRQGMLALLSSDIKERLAFHVGIPLNESPVESEVEYPLTPPLSDDSDSRPLSPNEVILPKTHVSTIILSERKEGTKRRRSNSWNVLKRRRPQKKEDTKQAQPFTLHLISRKSGKVAVANMAASMLREHKPAGGSKSVKPFQCSMDDVTRILEGEQGFSSPDLLIMHDISPMSSDKTLELEGFPPWQIRLTELSYIPRHSAWHRSWKEPSSMLKLDEREFRQALDEFASAEMRLGK